jgi:hypothetical protein
VTASACGAVRGQIPEDQTVSHAVAAVLERGVTRKDFTMKTTPYHSSNLADPHVHHDHSDCPAGKQIPAANRRSGTNGCPAMRAMREDRLAALVGTASTCDAV